jgi:hypothetical protein
MSDNRDELRPYEEALADLASDWMADADIPQEFWPAQVIRPKRAITESQQKGGEDAARS